MSRRTGRPGDGRRTAFDPRAWLVPGAAALLALVGVALLWSGGRFGSDEARNRIRPGEVGVPVASVGLTAYTELQIEHLLDPQTGDLATVFLPEESILESTIVDPAELVGRVLARPKSAGRIFREEDFLPIGTRPGLVAGIPSGKRALRIDASRVSGIVGLQQGDRFDLVATYPGQSGAGRIDSVYGASGSLDPRMSARARTVAENAAVVTALESRQLPAGGRTGAIVQEMVIALDPGEVTLVTEALEVAKRIDCIPRSGLPGETNAARQSDGGAPARTGLRTGLRAGEEPLVDMIEGDRRALRRVPLQSFATEPLATEPPAVGAAPARSPARRLEGGS